MLTQLGPSLIRTIVPLIVGAVVAYAAQRGTDVGPWTDVIAQAVGAVVAAAYYTLARSLETWVSKRFGWLLGLPKAPSYDGPTVIPGEVVVQAVPAETVDVEPQTPDERSQYPADPPELQPGDPGYPQDI